MSGEAFTLRGLVSLAGTGTATTELAALDAEVKTAGTSATGLGTKFTSLDSTASKLGVTTGGLGGKLGALTGLSTKAGTGLFGLSSAATIGVGAFAALAVGVGVTAVHAYDAHEAALVQLQNSLSNNAGLIHANTSEFDQLADSIMKTTGVSRDEIVAAAAVGARFATTTDQLKAMIPVAVDLSVKLGVDVPTAMKMIGVASEGNTRALKALGINTAGASTALKGMADQGDRTAWVLDQIKPKVQGVADAMGKTLGGQINILKGQIHDLEIELGGQLTPTLATTAKGINIAFGPAMTAVVKAAGDAFRVLGERIAWPAIAAGQFVAGLVSLTGVMGNADQKAAVYAAQMQTVGGRQKDAETTAKALALANAGLGTTTSGVGTAVTGLSLQDQLLIASQTGVISQQKLLGQSMVDSTNAMVANANAARTDKLSLDSLAGGFIAVASDVASTTTATDTLNAAEATLTKDEKSGHATRAQLAADHAAVAAAAIAATTAHISLTDSVLNFVNQEVAAGVPMSQVIADVKSQGAAAGVSKGDMATLVAIVQAYIDKINNIPPSKTTTVTFDTIYRQSGSPVSLRQHGGPVQAGQPYIVGEKRPELFVPDTKGRIEPSVPDTKGRIEPSVPAGFDRGAGGGGGQTRAGVTIYGDVNVTQAAATGEDVLRELAWLALTAA
jgi:hypothetical protein